MKKLTKLIVVSVLGWQVRKLRRKNNFKIISVVGSYGKTSTKAAIAQFLATKYRVQWQRGNYNDLVSVPLVFFGLELPELFSPKAWLKTFWQIEKILKKPYPYDFVVLELGTDGPGQIIEFSRYLEVDLAVVTSLAPEHMEFFEDMEEVAKEELSVGFFANQLLINGDLAPEHLMGQAPIKPKTYSVEFKSKNTLEQWQLRFDDVNVTLDHQTVSKAQIYSISSAYVVGSMFGMNSDELMKGIKAVDGMPGRMNVLLGKNGSVIIDDSYNASPEAVKLALETLYSYSAKKRIALLGNMNELGVRAADLHRQIGELCNPKNLNLIVTLGADANTNLATAAEAKGCKVMRAKTPYEAGKLIAKQLQKGDVVLIKGSQNGVYAEEAIKFLLQNPDDAKKLVRQSSDWLAKKQKNFAGV